MKAKIVIYNVYRAGRSAVTGLSRELYGYKDYSNRCKHIYYRKGLLDEIPFIKPIRSVFIVRRADAPKLVEILKKYGAKFYIWDIILTNAEKKRLRKI